MVGLPWAWCLFGSLARRVYLGIRARASHECLVLCIGQVYSEKQQQKVKWYHHQSDRSSLPVLNNC